MYSTTNISQELAQYIIGQASKRYCLQSAKKEVLGQLTKKQAQNFTYEYTNYLVRLQNLTESTQKHTLGNEDTQSSPTCHKNKQNFQYTSAFATPNQQLSLSVNNHSSKKISRLNQSYKSKYVSQCLPLEIKEENDVNIELLRQKKYKLSRLQTFLKQNEQPEKIKYKLEKISKNCFTTDYNGEKIQIKKLQRRVKKESYLITEISTNIREERETNRKIFPESNFNYSKLDSYSKQNRTKLQSRKSAPFNYRDGSTMTLAMSSKRMFTRQSAKLDYLTLKEMQKELRSQKKAQKFNLQQHKTSFSAF